MTTNILEVKNLTKSFGDYKVIDNLTFKLEANKVYGFLGQNGAGKTTTIKIILGLLSKNGGEVFVNGHEVKFGQTLTNDYIGYLNDVPTFYPYMSAYEYLKLCAELTNYPSKEIKSRCNELLQIVGLDGVKQKIGGYSRGMKQRLGIAQALINKPKLLICDEPTSALDVKGRNEILTLLKNIKSETTVFFSTHILSDVEHICDEILILDEGKIRLSGDINELKAKYSEHKIVVELESSSDNAKLEMVLTCNKFGFDFDQNTFSISQSTQSDYNNLLTLLATNDIRCSSISIKKPSLEEIYLKGLS